MAELASDRRQTCGGAVMENRPDREVSGTKLTACLGNRDKSRRAVAWFGTRERRAARIQQRLHVSRGRGVKFQRNQKHADMCHGTPLPEETCTLHRGGAAVSGQQG